MAPRARMAWFVIIPPSVEGRMNPAIANRPCSRAGHRCIPPVLQSPGVKLKLGENDDQMGSCRVGNLRKLEGRILLAGPKRVKFGFSMSVEGVLDSSGPRGRLAGRKPHRGGRAGFPGKSGLSRSSSAE